MSVNERSAVERVITLLERKGFQVVGVYDGEETTHPKTPQEVLDLVFNLDESSIRVRKEGGKEHGILIVLGNASDGSEVVSDWNYIEGDPDGFDAAMDEITSDVGFADERGAYTNTGELDEDQADERES